ncbi:MAG TPA: hypothetical protein PLU72_04425 [Candidatus Ozemobacteraceae bacterium]|nr:hypothetical protein [Candidatus Ozemobacteraceae bacterium]HQG28733.1 hypothetical protein [Candidatus Ozemobacteraceae bacterium]
MELGKESWKWGLVLILLAVFLVIGHQAYVAVTSQEDYPPPDDYKQGDSYDIERNPGPGAGQPVSLPESAAFATEAVAIPEPSATGTETEETMPTELPSSMPDSFQNIGGESHPSPDWSDVKDPSQQ